MKRPYGMLPQCLGPPLRGGEDKEMKPFEVDPARLAAVEKGLLAYTGITSSGALMNGYAARLTGMTCKCFRAAWAR